MLDNGVQQKRVAYLLSQVVHVDLHHWGVLFHWVCVLKVQENQHHATLIGNLESFIDYERKNPIHVNDPEPFTVCEQLV